MREYGSEYHWQSRQGFEGVTRRREIYAWRFYRSGRDALKQVARLHRGARVLLPALCCESMILPFTLNGCPVAFYKLKPDLTGDEADVLSKAAPGTVLLYMPYFDIQPFTTDFLARLRQSGVVLLEDRTQDIIVGRPAPFLPDYTVASIRKWAALPEGGILKTAAALPRAGADGRFGALRRQAMEEKGLYLENGDAGLKQDFLAKFHEADALLDESGEPVAMSMENRAYLENIDFARVLAARRRNARVLEQTLAELTAAGKLRPLCKSGTTAGLYYPILLENRDAVQQALARQNIYCPVIWPVPAQARDICENCEATAAQVLALPCDQRYSEQDMATIAETLKAIVTGEE